MSEVRINGDGFTGYEYKQLTACLSEASLLLDGYRSFGWSSDESIAGAPSGNKIVLRLKRDRKIANKTELTRLQRHFEACVDELRRLEKAKSSRASGFAVAVGIAGTCFMAASTFAATAEPPVIWLCALLAVPGFAGWTAPYFLYRWASERQAERLGPLIEAKYEEIYSVCEKGSKLL